ncbi:MAG: hypothetical protein GXP45_08330 [bacterium]|nr:hypothetical protein [bacterium]
MPKYNEELLTMFQDADKLLFYKIMNYPVPHDYHFFLTQKKKIKEQNNITNFSRKHKPQIFKEYQEYITRQSKLVQSVPFVEKIYLCNSLSFNGLKQGSDIDIFLIVKDGALRRARFFSVLFFFLKGILRKRVSRKRFCLSFYCSNKTQNLYKISLAQTDIYLAYWLAHLYPRYQEKQKDNTNIYQNNLWLKEILPNINEKHHIHLDIPQIYGKRFIKKFLEFFFGSLFGKFSEIIIKSIRLPLVIIKKKRLGDKGKDVIISKNMLKFYQDKRRKIRLLYQLEKKEKTSN